MRHGAAEPVWLPELIQEGPPVPSVWVTLVAVVQSLGRVVLGAGWEVVAKAMAHPSVQVVTE